MFRLYHWKNTYIHIYIYLTRAAQAHHSDTQSININSFTYTTQIQWDDRYLLVKSSLQLFLCMNVLCLIISLSMNTSFEFSDLTCYWFIYLFIKYCIHKQKQCLETKPKRDFISETFCKCLLLLFDLCHLQLWTSACTHTHHIEYYSFTEFVSFVWLSETNANKKK